MLTKNDIDIKVTLTEMNRLEIKSNKIENCEYAFYIYKDDKCIDKISYSAKNEIVYWLSLPGEYRVSVFVKELKLDKVRKESNTIYFSQEGMLSNNSQNKNQKGIFKKAYMIVKELCKNIVLAVRMAKFDYQLENKDTYLGKVWSLLTPLIQIGTYWFVFGIGLRQSKDVDGYPFIIWMLCGIIPWFYINGGILQGANSIMKKANTLTRMRFPLSTVPLSAIIVCGFEHIMMLFVMFVMFLSMGVYPSIWWLNIIYYIIYMVFFLTSLSLITSVFTVIARDFYKLLQSMMKLLFYVTPVLWTMDKMPMIFQYCMEFNPIYYIIKGFRESILYNIPFYNNIEGIIFFWTINTILFIIGANLQVKFRNKFIDLI